MPARESRTTNQPRSRTRHWMSAEECHALLAALERRYRRKGPLPFEEASRLVQSRASRRFSRATIYRLLGTHGWKPRAQWVRVTTLPDGGEVRETRTPEELVLTFLEEPGRRISVSTLYRRLASMGWKRDEAWMPTSTIPSPDRTG